MECESIDSNDMSIGTGGCSAAVYVQDAPYYPTSQHVPPVMDFYGYRAYIPTEVATGCDGLMPLLPPSPSQSPESNSHLRRIQPAHSPDRLIRLKNRPAFPSQLLRSQSAGNMKFAAISSDFGLVKRISPTDKERPGRKKGLSLEQKRAMCRLHDKHPNMRQADIGQIFGVDRSTISKVLRRRDLQLERESQPNSVGARDALGRYPQLEGFLTTYIWQHQQQRGLPVSDTQLLEQIRIFANQRDDESILSVISEDWLDGFKEKHAIGIHPRRRISEPNVTDRAQSPPAALPILPVHEAHTQPTKREASPEGANFDFGHGGSSPHLPTQPQPTNPLDSAGSFSSDGMSPDEGASSNSEHLVYNSGCPPSYTHSHSKPERRLRRSKTLPSSSIGYGATSSFGSDIYSGYSIDQPSTVEPKTLELSSNMIDTQMTAPPALCKVNSYPRLTAQPYTTPGSTPGLVATPEDHCQAHPSQEDASRAASTLLAYLESMSLLGNFEPKEYMTVLKLSKKLQEPSQFPQTFFAMPPPMGGLGDIPESETTLM